MLLLLRMVQHLNSVVFLVCINELTNFERFECFCFLLEAQLYERLNCYPCRILVLKFFSSVNFIKQS